jgi:hypothetical protein
MQTEEHAMPTIKGTLNKVTREYVRNAKRIAQLEERNRAIKTQVLEMYPEGIDTEYGKWQVYSDGTRVSFERKSIEGLVSTLVLEGNGEMAKRILSLKNESITSGGVRFIIAKD